MDHSFTILGIAGSLRKGSYNQMRLRAAQQLTPAGTQVALWDKLGELPLFNQDLEKNPRP